MGGFLEANGNLIAGLSSPPPLPDEEVTESDDNDEKDLSRLIRTLPAVRFDNQVHFRKRSKYCSEILNLLRCQGGTCPGTPSTPHLVQLLGADPKTGDIVFPKFNDWQSLHYVLDSIGAFKECILHLVSGLQALHSLGIIHKGLRLANLLFDKEQKRLIICDLESGWGTRFAPEIESTSGLGNFWTVKSDIFDLGICIQHLIYFNNPILPTLHWPVPPPFDKVFEACTQREPEQRPSLEKIREMVELICEDDMS